MSEALALTATRVDLAAGVVVLESLKKRRKGIYRAVPVPPAFLETLVAVHDLGTLGNTRLWAWSRSTAWRRVKEVMEAATIRGLCASPKGVRHGFGIKAVSCQVPLNLTQKWLGHARASPRRRFTPMPSAPKRKTSRSACGHKKRLPNTAPWWRRFRILTLAGFSTARVERRFSMPQHIDARPDGGGGGGGGGGG